MAPIYTTNLIIYTGTDFDQTFSLEDTDTNSALDLTGYSGCAQFKKYHTSTTAYSFDVTFSADRTTGTVILSMDSSTTSSLKSGRYYYDVLLSSPQGVITRVVEGRVFVKKLVTG